MIPFLFFVFCGWGTALKMEFMGHGPPFSPEEKEYLSEPGPGAGRMYGPEETRVVDGRDGPKEQWSQDVKEDCNYQPPGKSLPYGYYARNADQADYEVSGEPAGVWRTPNTQIFSNEFKVITADYLDSGWMLKIEALNARDRTYYHVLERASPGTKVFDYKNRPQKSGVPVKLDKRGMDKTKWKWDVNREVQETLGEFTLASVERRMFPMSVEKKRDYSDEWPAQRGNEPCKEYYNGHWIRFNLEVGKPRNHPRKEEFYIFEWDRLGADEGGYPDKPFMLHQYRRS